MLLDAKLDSSSRAQCRTWLATNKMSSTIALIQGNVISMDVQEVRELDKLKNSSAAAPVD